ncbi:MAG: VRR-NUC domain-containing protein [Candidatus Thorarchaeota archaeon]
MQNYKIKNQVITEHSLQCQVVKILRLHKIFCFAVLNHGLYSLANNQYKYLDKCIKEGMIYGIADLICLLEKRTIFLELKVKNNKQTKNQKIFEENVKKIGYEYYIIRKIEDLNNIFQLNLKKG